MMRIGLPISRPGSRGLNPWTDIYRRAQLMRSTPQRWFSWFVFLSFAVILAVAGTAAAGRDLGLLADTLSSNFFAQQVSTICTADNPRFQQNAIGKLGDASAYASLVKREIVMNLPESEAEAWFAKLLRAQGPRR